MASAHIRLDIDPVTRKRTIVISYESDSDALPHEHEEAHRALVEKLFEGGIAKQGDDIQVERAQEKGLSDASGESEPQKEGAKQGS